jgi:hypothetical protein
LTSGQIGPLVKSQTGQIPNWSKLTSGQTPQVVKSAQFRDLAIFTKWSNLRLVKFDQCSNLTTGQISNWSNPKLVKFDDWSNSEVVKSAWFWDLAIFTKWSNPRLVKLDQWSNLTTGQISNWSNLTTGQTPKWSNPLGSGT